jgi:hypothetical protein
MALNISIDTSEVVAYAKHLGEAQKLTKPIITTGLNEVGDGLLTVLATALSRQTGLNIEEVRGVINVKRASRSHMTYELELHPNLLTDPSRLEGKRESGDFGKRQPGALVIVVSKHDELVCMDCEELEAAGPMPVEVAKAHIPKHPNCRCVIMPYVEKGKRLPVTMTTLTGTDAAKRADVANVDLTIRQIAQSIMEKTANKIRIELL